MFKAENTAQALELLAQIAGDLEQLSAGDWVPNAEGCAASIEALDAARAFFLKPETGTETAREQLDAMYMDYFNNYLTPAGYGEHNGLTEAQAATLLTLAREVNRAPHPEA